MRKVQTIFPTGSTTQGRSFLKGLLDRMGTSGAISPVKDGRIQHTQDYLVAPLAGKRRGLILVLFLIIVGIGVRLWFRRQRREKPAPISSRTQGKPASVSSGTYGILIFFAFLLGLGIGARGWFRQRLQGERVAVSFTSKRGGLTFLALFRRPVADEPEPVDQYSVATPLWGQFNTLTTTTVDAKSTPPAMPSLEEPVVVAPHVEKSTPITIPIQEQPGVVALDQPVIAAPSAETNTPIPIPTQEQPGVVANAAIDEQDEDTIRLPRPRPPIVAEPGVTPVQRQMPVERRPASFIRTRSALLIFLLLVVLVGLGVTIAFRLHPLTPFPVAHLTTPTPVVRPPTPTSIPTPVPTHASVVYPKLAGAYQGTLYDVAARVGTSMSLTQIRQNQGKISGYFTVGPKLKGSGSFSGTIDTARHVQFIVTDATGHATLFFEGTMQSASSLTGNYYRCIQAQGNQCNRDPSGGYGLWNVVLA